MATILDNYRNLQNNYRSQSAANSLPLEDNLKMQEDVYKRQVLGVEDKVRTYMEVL